MSAGYEQIRTALNRGFSVDNLRLITKLSLEIVREEIPLHPAIPLTIAMLSRWIADSWEDVAISTVVASRVEGQIKPHIERLLALGDADPARVCAAIDETALAFAEAVFRGLDSDLT